MRSNVVAASEKELFYDDFSDEWESRINKWETNKRLRIVFGELLNSGDINGKRFLEVGCGLGFFSQKAAELGAKVTGVDVGARLVKKNRKKIPKGRFLVASASDLPFSDNSFDVVLCTEVIEHVEDQGRAVKELVRVLKKGGVLVVTTPNRIFKPIFDLLSFLQIRPYHGNENWIFPWDFKEMLLKEGLVLEREKYFNFIILASFFDRIVLPWPFKYLTINYGFVCRKI
jgi:2-polyprenyl-6-hydroxyphenyl methylase/3-demethylubiquinone-9 3-methyltransferase